jgi:hypothetical protein
MGGLCSMYGKIEKYIETLAGRPEGMVTTWVS